MKIQSLAVIFIIIMLPISLVLTAYVQNQVQTINLQTSYDEKLTNATYDALKAFQLNTINSSTSDLANSKLRDINASVNTFFNAIAEHFNLAGYDKDTLQNYVPALVYTMYDGYYIYSPFTNTLNDNDAGTTYTDGQKLYGLKPYIHYSCRYVDGGTDVVITYTLDNCITVEGTINGEGVYKTGYLLDDVNVSGSGTVTYRGTTIEEESLSEQVGFYENSSFTKGDYYYTKIDGAKTYNEGDHSFTMLNGQKINTATNYGTTDSSAIEYYKNAYEFTKWVRDNLGGLTTSDIVDENGNKNTLQEEFGSGVNIFGSQGNINIEDPNSDFNQHRLAVIRYTIEKNLSIAIANYNRYASPTSANFQMPELQEDEWEEILNNVSIISFMQGLSIGGKIYNGYSIVTNTKTKEVVNTDAIYIITNDGYYHRATDTDLIGNNNIQDVAYLNIDFERNSITDGTTTQYYYPHNELRLLYINNKPDNSRCSR